VKLLGRAAIEAVQFSDDPEPDYLDVYAHELPYDDAPGSQQDAIYLK
jgi:hypothetical protein